MVEFGLYVSPVAGHTVRRFGAPPNTYIGAKRVGKQMEWDEWKIVPIPENEARKYRAEYEGAITDGALKRRTADEYKAQQEDLPKKREEARKKKREEAEAKARETAAKQPDATSAGAATGIRAIAESANAPGVERPKALLLSGQEGDS
jgi:hypothetical protein